MIRSFLPRAAPLFVAALLFASSEVCLAGGHGGYGWHGGYRRGWGYGYGWGGYGWGWDYGYGWGGYGWGGYGYGWDYPPAVIINYLPSYAPPLYGAPAVDPEQVLPAPRLVPPPAPAPTDNAAHLQITAPGADAEVWLNGVRTRQVGSEQSYKSPPVTPGEKYSYEVKARWTENGKVVERTQTVLVQANQRLRVDLGKAVPETPTSPTENVAHLQIAAPGSDAEVWLNGVRTKQTGSVQRYQTPPMTPGEKYSYEVKARWTENGQSVERTRTIVVRANEKLKVDLGMAEVAAK